MCIIHCPPAKGQNGSYQVIHVSVLFVGDNGIPKFKCCDIQQADVATDEQGECET